MKENLETTAHIAVGARTERVITLMKKLHDLENEMIDLCGDVDGVVDAFTPSMEKAREICRDIAGTSLVESGYTEI